jgi:tetratricopeptide (TPR) repeat protein
MPASPAPFDIACALLREGRLADAEQLMVKELRAAERRHGRGSPEWASAQCDLGNILLGGDQPKRAVECFRSACSGPVPKEPGARKDHLTYQLNLALVLAMTGRLDEAEAEMRRNLDERLAFYGREHAGYAFGLEVLADVLFQRGNIGEARKVADEMVANLWRNGHERVAAALALRAELVTAQGGNEPLFPRLEQLPDKILKQLAAEVTSRARRHPDRTFAALSGLVTVLDARLGPDDQATLNALSCLANTSHDLGNEEGRVEAIRKVLASYDRQGRTEDALKAASGLARAQSDAGDITGALQTFEQAQPLADRIGRPELSSQLLRNWGLALAEAGQLTEAEQRLRAAVAAAGRGYDGEMLGRAQVALGLFLQHHERLAEARETVEAGLANLDAAHPDAVCGRSHLGAISAGQGCGCGDVRGAMADAFREFVAGRLPQDLLARLDVTIEDGNFNVKAELRREPTEAELEQLNQVVSGATAEFRRRQTSARYAS